MIEEERLLFKLKYKWKIESVVSKAKGYWELDEDSLDLSDLHLLSDRDKLKDGDLYLVIEGELILIKIFGDKSYYIVEELKENQMNLTLYFQLPGNVQGPIEICTLQLKRF